jgi:hypothetical protein
MAPVPGLQRGHSQRFAVVSTETAGNNNSMTIVQRYRMQLHC